MDELMFSVIVPVYNVENYLSECIDSILSQTYTNFELILVDDGSKDSSGKICDEYALNDSRIKVIHKENGGQISARVAGFKASSGKYALFVDSDDKIFADALITLNKYIGEFKPDCIIFGWERFDNTGALYSTKPQFVEPKIINKKSDLLEIVLNDYGYNSVCRKATKREFIDNIDFTAFHDVRFGEDLIESLEIYANASEFLFVPEILYKYRMNGGSVTHSADIKSNNYNFTAREETFKLIERLGCFNEQQMENYRGYCVKLLTEALIRIANFEASNKEKIKIFRSIKRTVYYQNRISRKKFCRKKVGKKIVFYGMFRMNMYGSIILFSKTVNLLRRIYRTKIRV